MSEYMLSKDYFVQVIRDLIVLAEDRKEYFTDLDSAIGDGDHGINLSIGFRKVVLKNRLPCQEVLYQLCYKSLLHLIPSSLQYFY